MSASEGGRCRSRRVVWTRLLCLGIAGVITFPIVDYLLYGSDWSHGNGPTLVFVAVEAGLASAIGMLAHRLLFQAKRPN
jgi:hypothetical protein